MAKRGQMIDELYISLGLDIARLQLDFDTAGKTVSQAISKLNSGSNKIKLKMETDLTKLDGVGTELDKIKVKYSALNQQLDIQKQKAEILTAVLRDAQKNSGKDSGAAQKAETDLLRQQKLIAQTESELRKLSAAMTAAQGTIKINVDAEKIKNAEKNISESISRMNAKIQNIRLKAEIDISSLRGANSEIEREKINIRALNKELELQNKKLLQLQNAFKLARQNYGGNNILTLNAQSNVFQQMREIEKLQSKIRELQNSKVDIKISTDFRQAEQKIRESISRMNAKIQNIKVKAEFDAANLKAGSSEIERQKIAVNALNKELAIQYKKLLQIQNAYKLSQKHAGTNSAAAINAQTDLIRQRQTVKNLENEIKKLNGEISKVGANTTGFNKISVAVGKVKSKIEGAVSSINQMNSAFIAGTAAVAGVAGIFKLTENAMKTGHEAVKLSTRLHTTTAEALQLKRAFGLVDADIGAAIPIFARLGKQIYTAGENGNTLTNATETYGFTLTDASGKLLPYTKMLDELAKGYRNAQEAGESVNFVTEVLGARGTALEPLLADYEFLMSASKDVKSSGLLDPQKAEDAYREYKKLEFELGQLKGAAGAALLPVSRELMPEVVGGFKTLVGFIGENKEGLKNFGELAGDVFGGTAKAIMTVVAALGSLKKNLGEISGSSETEKILKNAEIPGLNKKLDKISTLGTIIGGGIGTYWGGIKGGIGGAAVGSEFFPFVSEQIYKLGLAATGEWDYYKQKSALIEQEKKSLAERNKILSEFDESKSVENTKKAVEVRKNLENELAAVTSEKLREKLEGIKSSTEMSIAAGKSEVAAWKSAEREITKAIKEARKEAEKANEELKDSIYKLTHNDLQNSFDAVEVDSEKMLERGADRELAEQNAELQRQKIRDDFNRDVLNKIDETYQTELEKRLNAIETEKNSWIQKGLDEVSAVEWAESEKSKAIENFNNEVAANLDSIWQTELEKRLAQIEREKKAWIDKGVEEVKATEWAEQAKVDAKRNAALNILKQNLQEYRAFQTGGYEGLQNYQLQQLFKSGISPQDLMMTPEQLAEFQKAKDISQKSLLPNFMSDRDRAEESAIMNRFFEERQRKIEEENEKIRRGITISEPDNFLSEKLADLSAAITNLSEPKNRTQISNSPQTNSAPPEVNVTVQIQEAHAWDTEHIQELADKVADEITPEIVGAIGGDSNSY